MNLIDKSKRLLDDNRKIVENYFFMTVLQILNSLFYLLIYPFLIRTLGVEGYGLYAFVLSIVTLFITLVGFGFDLPAAKAIAQNAEDDEKKSQTLSGVFSAKFYLELVAILVFAVMVYAIPTFRSNWLLFVICFIQTFTFILFPQWYFQGVQRMRVVTYIQMSFKLLSLPLIFMLIKQPTDVLIFMLIISLTSLLGGFTAWLLIRWKDNLRIHLLSLTQTLCYYKQALPFFLSSATGIVKEQSIVIIIGSLLSMTDVALYDLANKVIMVPRTLMMNLNGALFPKIVANAKRAVIKKIIRYETYIGLAISAAIGVFGYWIVLLLGGTVMLEAFPLAVILSFTVLVWLVVGAYINFVFIPQDKYYFVTKNQVVAIVSFFIYCIVGLMIVQNVYVLVVSITLSGFTEIIYSNYLIRKNKLL